MSDSSQPTVEAMVPLERAPGRLGRYVKAQREILHVRLLLTHVVMGPIPVGVLGNIRAKLYRWAGFRHIGDKVYIFGRLDLRGSSNIYQNLEIGPYCEINAPCFIDLHAQVRIGTGVGIGHHTVIVTSNHFVGPPDHRCGDRDARPVTISDGAWIACSVTLMPGVVVGKGAVVTTGSVVTKSVPAHSKVSGNPARVIGWLDDTAETIQAKEA